MMVNQPTRARNLHVVSLGLLALVLASSLSSPAHARQLQQDQEPGQGLGQQPDGAQEPKAKPAYASQDADKPPYAHDRQQPNAAPGQYPASHSEQRTQAVQSVPGILTLPSGTLVVVRINEFLSSDKNQIGDPLTGELEQPIVVNGWVVARRGQVLTGKVKQVQKAGRVKGVSQLGVELTDLTVVDGQQVPVLTELWKGSGGTSHGQDAATVGTTTGLGAAIGAAADWGTGAAIGAGAGAAAGIATVLLTRGRPTILEPETQLSFRLVDPVRIDTTRGQQAFLPVTQGDYEGGRFERRGPPRLASGYPAYPCGYYSPCYVDPGYVGFYDDFWWGPRFHDGFGGRRGFRR